MRDEESENTDANQHETGEKGPKETGTPPSSTPGGVLAKGTSEGTLAGAHAKGVGHVTHPWWQVWHWWD